MRTLLITLLVAAAAPFAQAQTTGATSITVGTDLITDYSPGHAFIIREATGPVSCKVRDKVVTKSGKTLTEAEAHPRIRVGSPTSVQSTGEHSDLYFDV